MPKRSSRWDHQKDRLVDKVRRKTWQRWSTVLERARHVCSKRQNMIKRLTTCQILGKTHQSNKERKIRYSWKDKSNMTSMQFCQKKLPNIQREEPVYIGARQCHSREPGYVNVSRRKIEKIFATLLYHIGFSKDEDSLKYGGLLPGGFGTCRCRKESAFFTRIVIRSEPRTEAPPPHEEPSWPIVWDLFGNGAEFARILPDDERQCLVCYDTVPSKFLTQIINLKEGSEKFGKENKEEESSTTKRSRRDQGQPWETSWHNMKLETFEPWQLKEITGTAEIIEDNKSSDVYVQWNDCSLQMWFGGLTGTQEKNA